MRLIRATVFIAACARFAWARGQKHQQKRRAAWFLGSDHNFAVFIAEVMREWLPVRHNVGVGRRFLGRRSRPTRRPHRSTCEVSLHERSGTKERRTLTLARSFSTKNSRRPCSSNSSLSGPNTTSEISKAKSRCFDRSTSVDGT